MPHGLDLARTKVTKCLLWGSVAKVASTTTQGQGIEEKLVICLLVTWCTSAMVETRPNVRRRTTNLGDPPSAPVEWGINALALVEEPASQRGGERDEHDASDLNVCMQGAATAPTRWSG